MLELGLHNLIRGGHLIIAKFTTTIFTTWSHPMLDDAAKIAIPASHTQFSSLEISTFGLSVEISFHNFSHILY